MPQSHPLSHNQELMLAFAAEAGFPVGNWTDQVVLELAEYDERAVRAAVDALVVRHTALRTRIAPVLGRHAQVVDDPGPVGDLRVGAVDAPDRDRVIRAARDGFDLAAGPPVRALALPRSDGTATVVLSVSHLVTDLGSDEILAAEFADHYDGRDLAPAPVPYTDFARWQRAEVARYLRDATSVPSWQDYDAASAALAPGGASTEVPSGAPSVGRGVVELAVDTAGTAALSAAAREHGRTLPALLLAAVVLALQRVPGLDVELVVGDRAVRFPIRFDRTVGLFADIWPVCRPAALEAEPARVLDAVGARVIAALDGTLPFITLVARHPWLARQLRRPGGPPWMFFQFAAAAPARPTGSRVVAASFPDPPGPEQTAFVLHLQLVLGDGELRGTLDHRGADDDAGVRSFLGAWNEALARVAGTPRAVVVTRPR